MPHVLSRMPRAASADAVASGPFPNAAFAAVIALVLACGVGIANMPSFPAGPAHASAFEDGRPTQARATGVDLAAGAGTAQPRADRAVWGVVEDIKSVEGLPDGPAEFELTVRLRDRSAQHTRSVGRAKWRVGDRVMLMGGDGAPSVQELSGKQPCSLPSPSSC
jgi:hypothetical protein